VKARRGRGPATSESTELISSATGRVLLRIYSRLGPTYPTAAVAAQLTSGYPIAIGAILVLSLYSDAEIGQLAIFTACVIGLVALSHVVGVLRGRRDLAPVRRWLKGDRSPDATREAWEAAIALPGFYLRAPLPWLLGIAGPAAVAAYLTLDLTVAEAAAVFVGACVTVGYAAVLDYFSLEGMMRPVVADIARALPARAEAAAKGVSLKTKLLVALPFINVITGVIVATLTSRQQDDITELAVNILIASAVALTVSLLLVLRVTAAMLRPIGDLERAIEQVEGGRFDIGVPVTSGDEIGGLAAAFNRMAAGLAERERIREAFGTFVDPDVAEHILENPETAAGEEVEVTVMFLDVRGFTGFAERSPAPEVVETLNRLFAIVVPIVDRHEGQIDKFIGDGVMVVFGAPRPLPDHADRALAAACEIAAAVPKEFGDELQIGIGLNSGTVVAGTIGAEGRLNFSVIGDAVNVAARVEAATRETGDVVLLTESTRNLLQDPDRLERRGEVSLKGRSEPVVVYTPTDTPSADQLEPAERTASR
jgi:adenylate cyclase